MGATLDPQRPNTGERRKWHTPLRPADTEMPHCATRAALRCLTPPSLVLWLPNISTVHTQTHTYVRTHARTRTHWPRRCPFYSEWGQAPWISCLAPDFFFCPLPLFLSPLFTHFTPSQVYSLFGTPKKTKKNLEDHQLFFLSGNKSKLNEKTFFFIFIFFKFKAQCLSVFQSVCLHSQVQCANIASHKPLDYLLVRHSLQLTSLVCTFNTVKRSVCFGWESDRQVQTSDKQWTKLT